MSFLPIFSHPFTPLDLAGGSRVVRFWGNANKDATVIRDGSGNISRWKDISGNGNDAVQTIGASQPFYNTTTGIGGKSSITFNNDNLLLPSDTVLGMNNSEYEVFVVAQTSNAATQFIIAGSAFADKELHINGSAGARFIPRTGSADYADIGVTSDYSDGNPHIIAARVSGTTGIVSADGVDGVDTSATGISSTVNANMIIGLRAGPSLPFLGDIGEIIIIGGRSLSNIERSLIISYLQGNWSI